MWLCGIEGLDGIFQALRPVQAKTSLRIPFTCSPPTVSPETRLLFHLSWRAYAHNARTWHTPKSKKANARIPSRFDLSLGFLYLQTWFNGKSNLILRAIPTNSFVIYP